MNHEVRCPLDINHNHRDEVIASFRRECRCLLGFPIRWHVCTLTFSLRPDVSSPFLTLKGIDPAQSITGLCGHSRGDRSEDPDVSRNWLLLSSLLPEVSTIRPVC